MNIKNRDNKDNEHKIEQLLTLLKTYSEQSSDDKGNLSQKIIEQANILVQKKPKNIKLALVAIATCAFSFGVAVGVLYTNEQSSLPTNLVLAEQQHDDGLDSLIFEEEVPIELEQL